MLGGQTEEGYVSSAVAVGSSCSSSSRVVASTIFYVSFVGEFGQSLSYVFEEIFIFLFCLENAEEDDELIYKKESTAGLPISYKLGPRWNAIITRSDFKS